MVKLTVSRKYPFIRFTDVRLRLEVDRLRRENQDLRARLVAAQQEKALAQKQAETLRKEKERLRLKTVALKGSAEAGRKAQDALQSKFQSLREENEALKTERLKKTRKF